VIIVILFESVIFLKTEIIALYIYALIAALSALYVCKCSGFRVSDPLVDRSVWES